MIPFAKYAQKKLKLKAKLAGTMITLNWVEWPDGKPDEDPTTGATLETDAKQAENKSASVRAFVHFIAPSQSGYRKFAEIETGNAIVDFPLDLIRITDAGDTDLENGAVVDEITFSRANRDLSEDADSAVGTTIDPTTLESLSMEFASATWVQKDVGEELVQNWDTLYSGLNINRAMLMRKS